MLVLVPITAALPRVFAEPTLVESTVLGATVFSQLPAVSLPAVLALLPAPGLASTTWLGTALAPQGVHSPVEGLARAIQLAVTPVFLLGAISGLLGVLTSRMARIVDRVIELKQLDTDHDPLERQRLGQQLKWQRRRMEQSSRAVGLATLSFLLVAAVVAALFLGTLIPFNLTPVVATLFVMAMLALMGAVCLLLLEVRLGRRVLEFY
jgi:hypothetical protein